MLWLEAVWRCQVWRRCCDWVFKAGGFLKRPSLMNMFNLPNRDAQFASADTPISSIIILLYILYISYGYIARTGKVPPTICRLLVWMVTATGWWQACLSAIPKWKSREAGCQPAVVEVWWPANGTLRYFPTAKICEMGHDGTALFTVIF